MGGFCLGGFVQGDFVWGDFVLGGILSRGILSGGFVRGFCPRTGFNNCYKPAKHNSLMITKDNFK